MSTPSHSIPNALSILAALPDHDSAVAVVPALSSLHHPLRFFVGSPDGARRAVWAAPANLVLAHVDCIGEGAASLLTWCRRAEPPILVVVLTPPGREHAAAQAVMNGAVASLTTPISVPQLQRTLARVTRQIAQRSQAEAMHQPTLQANRSASPAPEGVAPVRFSPAVARRRSAEVQRFESALDSVYMDWQPVFDAKTLGPVGFEALLRSEEPRVPTPQAMLALAAQLGRRQQLDQQVLSSVEQDLSAGGLDGTIFVNITLAQLRQGSLGSVTDPLRPLAERVVLDIQASGRVEDPLDLAAQAQRMRQAGYRLALDDIGSRSDIIPLMLALRPDVLKLDRSATAGCDANPRKARFIRQIVSLAHTDGAQVLAEGLERLGELSTCRLLGCDLLQGYALGHPAAREHWAGVRRAVQSVKLAASG